MGWIFATTREFGVDLCDVSISGIAFQQVMPRLTSLLAEWRPLEEPDRGLQYFSAWRPLLESDAQRDAIFQVADLRRCPCSVSHCSVLCMCFVLGPPPRLANNYAGHCSGLWDSGAIILVRPILLNHGSCSSSHEQLSCRMLHHMRLMFDVSSRILYSLRLIIEVLMQDISLFASHAKMFSCIIVSSFAFHEQSSYAGCVTVCVRGQLHAAAVGGGAAEAGGRHHKLVGAARPGAAAALPRTLGRPAAHRRPAPHPGHPHTAQGTCLLSDNKTTPASTSRCWPVLYPWQCMLPCHESTHAASWEWRLLSKAICSRLSFPKATSLLRR